MRSGFAGSLSGWSGGAVVGGPRADRGGISEDLAARRGNFCARRRAIEKTGAVSAAVFSGAAAGSFVARRRRIAGIAPRGEEISRDAGERSGGTGFVPDREPGRFSGPELRIRKNKDDVSGEQRLRKARRSLRRRFGAGVAVSFAERRRRGDSRILWACDWRDGRDYAGAGVGVPKGGSGDCYVCTGGESAGEGWRCPRSCAGRRDGNFEFAGAFECG